ncbi:MAG: type II toxin-antitoxin system VapC family toxin [Chloroflexi bacterium]|nr:type II toxin-antitoxin system VapC family toxin [Chloroflexota bacterium]
MSAYLVDTNVFVYARGGEHAYREPCRSVLRAAASGQVTLHASVELVQEFAHVLLRRAVDRADALLEIDEVRCQCRLHAFDGDVLRIAFELLGRYSQLGVRDAVHAATALRVGVEHVLSTDRAFDDMSEVTRVDPKQLRWPPPSGSTYAGRR